MEIKNMMVTNNPLYYNAKSFEEVKGIIIASLRTYNKVEDYIRTIDKGGLFAKSPHFIISEEGTIFQTLPENYRAKVFGKNADKYYIQIAVQEPKYADYKPSGKFTVPDLISARITGEKAYLSLSELCASLCDRYKLNPVKEGVVISRAEGKKLGICSGGNGVEYIWQNLGLVRSMMNFRKEIAEAIKMN